MLANVVVVSIVPVIAGAIFYCVLIRFLVYKRANTIFLVIASIALVLIQYTNVPVGSVSETQFLNIYLPNMDTTASSIIVAI